jgi:hypothetical protein
VLFNILNPTSYLMQQRAWHSKIADSAHTVFISEQTATFALYNINCLMFVTVEKCFLRGMNWVFKIKRLMLYL